MARSKYIVFPAKFIKKLNHPTIIGVFVMLLEKPMTFEMLHEEFPIAKERLQATLDYLKGLGFVYEKERISGKYLIATDEPDALIEHTSDGGKLNLSISLPKRENESIDWDALLDHFRKTFGKEKTVLVSNANKAKYRTRFKEGYSMQDVFNAMTNASKTIHHIEHKYRHCTLEFFSRSDKLDMYSVSSSKTQAVTPTRKTTAIK